MFPGFVIQLLTQFFFQKPLTSFLTCTEPHSSVGSIADLRTGGRWFDPLLGQYSFRGLMIATAVSCFNQRTDSPESRLEGNGLEVFTLF